MKKETFSRAKQIQSTIDIVKGNMTRVQKMKARQDDEEFNTCRSLAYDSMDAMIRRLESEFEQL